ncbi:DUF928 domain-containing protein [Phormidesmis priestleyi]
MATRLISAILLGLSLMPIAALADDDKAPPSGRSAGGRGCGATTQSTPGAPSLILLAPQGRANQTVSTRPTFAWFVRNSAAVPIEFRLYAQENNRYKLIKEIKDDSFKSAAGITVLSLAQSTPELAVGRYRSQVELICDRSHPSGNLFAESELEVVSMPSALKTQLGETSDRASQVSLYAQSNFWYDALGTAINSLSDNTALKDLRSSLINKMALNNTERQLLQDSVIHPIQR